MLKMDFKMESPAGYQPNTDTITGHICKEIRVIMNELADSLANGDAKSMEEYRFVVGRIHGLAEAERICLDLEAEILKSLQDDAA